VLYGFIWLLLVKMFMAEMTTVRSIVCCMNGWWSESC